MTNSAGLSSAITSDPYLHISGTPFPGVVFDIDPSALFGIEATGLSLHDRDVDLLGDVSEVVASWQGFSHAHLPMSYWVGLGTQPRMDDVVRFVYVDQNVSYTFKNLTLVEPSWHYVTVVAVTEYGNTTVSSDGVLIIQNLAELLLSGQVYDGGEKRDIDYQFFTSFAAARWQFSPLLTQFVSHYQWAIYQTDGSNVSSMSDSAELVKSFENVGTSQLASAGGLSLEVGRWYTSAVRACHLSSCLPPIFSDGFQVSSSPQPPGNITATYTPLQLDAEYGTSTSGVLAIVWSPSSRSQIAYYEWGLGTATPAHELLQYWNEIDGSLTDVYAVINATVSLHTTNMVTLRGYNAAGLHSSSSTELQWIVDGEVVPQESVPRSKLTVFDIPDSQVPAVTTTDWRYMEYHEMDLTDIQYSSSPSSLSAAWPDLRYMTYEYSVSTVQQFQRCPSSDVLRCGDTIANAVTVSDLMSLSDGERYYICVRALRANAIHLTSATPQTLTACSNGITVDHSPPLGGCVEIAPPALLQEVSFEVEGSGDERLVEPAPRRQCGNGSQFQSSNSELHIVWDQFSDVERYGSPIHSSGVAYYVYAVGESAVHVTLSARWHDATPSVTSLTFQYRSRI